MALSNPSFSQSLAIEDTEDPQARIEKTQGKSKMIKLALAAVMVVLLVAVVDRLLTRPSREEDTATRVPNINSMDMATDQEPQVKPCLHNVTDLIDDEFEKKTGYKCCCDKRKLGEEGNVDDERGINSSTRANYCKVDYRWPLMKCSHPFAVKVRDDTRTSHDFRDTGGICEIARENVQVLATALNKADYCPENKYLFKIGDRDMQIDIPAAAL